MADGRMVASGQLVLQGGSAELVMPAHGMGPCFLQLRTERGVQVMRLVQE
jgi:hypothetical protein